jgi:hypothetical protein
MFANDTLLYIVSRHWVDLLFIELFRLHPLPFCSEPRSHLPCTPEAPSGVQARFALGIQLAAALLRRVAASFSPGSALFWLGSSPMAAWLSGWACGFASMKAMREAGELLIGFDYLNLTISMLATAVSALIILVFRPSTIVMGCYGAHAWLLKLLLPRQYSQMRRRPSSFDLRVARGAEHWAVRPLEELWTLSSKALSVMVMMLWGFTTKQLLVSGIDPAQLRHGPLYHRLLFLWAISLTSVLGFATVHCVRLRRRLSAEEKTEESADEPLSPGARSPDAGLLATEAIEGPSALLIVERRVRAEARPILHHYTSSTTFYPAPSERGLPSSPPLRAFLLPRHQVRARINQRTALCELLMLLEQTCDTLNNRSAPNLTQAF